MALANIAMIAPALPANAPPVPDPPAPDHPAHASPAFAPSPNNSFKNFGARLQGGGVHYCFGACTMSAPLHTPAPLHATAPDLARLSQ